MPGDLGVLGAAWIIVAIIVALWLLSRFNRNQYDFRVTVRARQVEVDGRVPPWLRQALIDFFLSDFPEKEKLRIYGRQRPDRTYALRFVGPITAGEQQQVRNFLMVTIGR